MKSSEINRDHDVLTTGSSWATEGIHFRCFLDIIGKITLGVLSGVIVRAVDDELLGSALRLNDDVVDEDGHIADLKLLPGLALVPRVSNLLGRLMVRSSDEKRTVVSHLVDERNLGDLAPREATVSRQEGALSGVQLSLEVLTDVTNSHDNTNGTLLTVGRRIVVEVISEHLNMQRAVVLKVAVSRLASEIDVRSADQTPLATLVVRDVRLDLLVQVEHCRFNNFLLFLARSQYAFHGLGLLLVLVGIRHLSANGLGSDSLLLTSHSLLRQAAHMLLALLNRTVLLVVAVRHERTVKRLNSLEVDGVVALEDVLHGVSVSVAEAVGDEQVTHGELSLVITDV